MNEITKRGRGRPRKQQIPAAETIVPPAPAAPKVGLVIPYLNEPDLQNTIKSALASCPGMAVFAVEDVDRRGPGQMRHQGTMKAIAAGCSVVITVDAHMRFLGTVLSDLVAAVTANPRDLYTCRVHHNERCAFDDNPYAGARITLKADNGTERVALCGQWAAPKEEVNCLMGACYAFSASRYIDIGMPWRLLQAWGGDEEFLSLANLFAGGKVRVIEGEAAHQYRASNRQAPSDERNYRIWANRFILLDMLPISQELRDELAAWNWSSSYPAQHRGEIQRIVDSVREETAGIRALLAKGGAADALSGARPFSVCMSSLQKPAPDKVPHQIVVRQVERCHRCGAVDPWIQSRGKVDRGAVVVAPARCRCCGTRATIHAVTRF